MKKLLVTFLVVFAVVVIIHMFIKRNPARVAAVKNAWKNGGSSSLLASLPGGTIAQAVASVVTDSTNTNKVAFPIQLGSSGKSVKFIQAALSLPITGSFDAATQAALQAKVNLMAIDKDAFVGMFENNSNGGAFPLGVGSQGLYVQDVQILLDLSPNGVFGTDTAAALVGLGVALPLTSDDYQRLVGVVLNFGDPIATPAPAVQMVTLPITVDHANPPIFDEGSFVVQSGMLYSPSGNVIGQTTTIYPAIES